MDPAAAPWRVLETPGGSQGDGPVGAATPGGVAAPTGPLGTGAAKTVGRAALPLRWLAMGLLAVSAALVLAVVLAIGGTDPVVTIPGGSDGPTASGAGGGIGASAGPGATGDGLVVEVAGAVARPGLYHLTGGARVADAITAAGGYGPRVDAARATATINLAARIADGDRILVPSRDDSSSAPVTGGGSPAGSGGGSGAGGSGSAGGAGAGGAGAGGAGAKLDLNVATEAELDTLPGIGPVTAAKIVAARAQQRFGSVDELRERKLVGATTFAKLRDLVTVH
jgi:competence protein ComEA